MTQTLPTPTYGFFMKKGYDDVAKRDVISGFDFP